MMRTERGIPKDSVVVGLCDRLTSSGEELKRQVLTYLIIGSYVFPRHGCFPSESLDYKYVSAKQECCLRFMRTLHVVYV